MSSSIKVSLLLTCLLAFIFGLFVFVRSSLAIPSAFTIGPLTIRYYALAIMAGVLLALYPFHEEKKKYKQFSSFQTEDALLWAFVPAIVLARIWHFIAEYPAYSSDPLQIFFVWQGGLTIMGAVLGGIIGASIYARKVNVKPLEIIDLAIIFVPLAQLVGRFGNFFNQELYGPVTNLPWGMYIDETKQFHHPAFLYEQVLNLLLFQLLYQLYRKKKSLGKGIYLTVYILGYSVIRFSLDFFRMDRKILFDLTSPQLIAIPTAIMAMVILFRIWNQSYVSKQA